MQGAMWRGEEDGTERGFKQGEANSTVRYGGAIVSKGRLVQVRPHLLCFCFGHLDVSGGFPRDRPMVVSKISDATHSPGPWREDAFISSGDPALWSWVPLPLVPVTTRQCSVCVFGSNDLPCCCQRCCSQKVFDDIYHIGKNPTVPLPFFAHLLWYCCVNPLFLPSPSKRVRLLWAHVRERGMFWLDFQERASASPVKDNADFYTKPCDLVRVPPRPVNL